jgi:hypothetical protein
MKYSVRWLPAAEQELAALWMAANQRASVAQAANQIDHELSKSPEMIGESRPSGSTHLLRFSTWGPI